MRLYKYLHSDRMEILNNLCIRFSPPSALNDPFELKPVITGLASPPALLEHLHSGLPELLTAEYEKLPSEAKKLISLEQFQAKAQEFFPKAEQAMLAMAQMATPILQEQLIAKLYDAIGILCLTTSPDNLLMWAHYADSHRGFLIEFDSKSSFFKQQRSHNDEFGFIREVKSQQNRPKMFMSEMEFVHVFLTKGESWGYEAEWRMLQPLSSAQQVINIEKDPIHLFKFPPKAIKNIILGSRMSDLNKSRIKDTIILNCDLSHVGIKEASISETEYKVLIPD